MESLEMSDGRRSYERSITSSFQFCVGLAKVRLQRPRFAPTVETKLADIPISLDNRPLFLDRPRGSPAHPHPSITARAAFDQMSDLLPGQATAWCSLAIVSHIATGHTIVTAGGKIADGRGANLRFGEGRKDFIVPEFIAWGDPAAAG
jgi:hypothetical protein